MQVTSYRSHDDYTPKKTRLQLMSLCDDTATEWESHTFHLSTFTSPDLVENEITPSPDWHFLEECHYEYHSSFFDDDPLALWFAFWGMVFLLFIGAFILDALEVGGPCVGC